jgi:acetyltransferase
MASVFSRTLAVRSHASLTVVTVTANNDHATASPDPEPHSTAATLGDGARIRVRPMRLDELIGVPRLFTQLSARSRYQRFLAAKRSLDPTTIANLADAVTDPASAVLVAVVRHLSHDEIIGGIRVVPCARRGNGEFAITIIDAWQGRGVGSLLLRAMVRAARRLGYHRIEGWILPTNTAMLMAAKHAGFRVIAGARDGSVRRVTRTLHRSRPSGLVARRAPLRGRQWAAADDWLRRRAIRRVVAAATAECAHFQ